MTSKTAGVFVSLVLRRSREGLGSDRDKDLAVSLPSRPQVSDAVDKFTYFNTHRHVFLCLCLRSHGSAFSRLGELLRRSLADTSPDSSCSSGAELYLRRQPSGCMESRCARPPSFITNLSYLSAVAPTIYSDLHVVGNDRLFGFVAADGGVALRQDEGGPKILDDFSPSLFQYGGGIGWLLSGSSTVCDTNVTPSTAHLTQSMVMGVAYLTKTCSEPGGLLVEHTIWAPFGDVAALVSTVTITNRGTGQPQTVTWLEQWAAGAPVLLIDGLKRPTSWNASFESLTGGIGVLSRKRNPTGNPAAPVLADDPSPRPSFLLSLDAAMGNSPAPSFGVDGSALFGDGGPRSPSLAAVTNTTALPGAGWSLRRRLRLWLASHAPSPTCTATFPETRTLCRVSLTACSHLGPRVRLPSTRRWRRGAET